MTRVRVIVKVSLRVWARARVKIYLLVIGWEHRRSSGGTAHRGQQVETLMYSVSAPVKAEECSPIQTNRQINNKKFMLTLHSK